MRRFGQWNGYLYTLEEFPDRAMTSLTFQSVPDNPSALHGSGVDVDALLYTIEGQHSISDQGVTEVRFTVSYDSGDPTEYFVGHLDHNGALVGHQGYAEDVSEENHSCLFVFRNVPAEIMAWYPSPTELEQNKPRALWKFALEAVMMQIRRKGFSWKYFKERRDHRRRYIELSMRSVIGSGPPLSVEENTEFLKLLKSLLPIDALYYLSARKRMVEIGPKFS